LRPDAAGHLQPLLVRIEWLFHACHPHTLSWHYAVANLLIIFALSVRCKFPS
jgi:hypothetical protein